MKECSNDMLHSPAGKIFMPWPFLSFIPQ
jgi:hypothetical protein